MKMDFDFQKYSAGNLPPEAIQGAFWAVGLGNSFLYVNYNTGFSIRQEENYKL